MPRTLVVVAVVDVADKSGLEEANKSRKFLNVVVGAEVHPSYLSLGVYMIGVQAEERMVDAQHKEAVQVDV